MTKSKTKKGRERDPLDRDLSSMMGEKGKWVRFNDLFNMQPKNKTITLRVSEDLLKEVKKIAEKEDTDYQKLIRGLIIEFVARKAS